MTITGARTVNCDLIHIVASTGEEASGPSYSVPALCGALAQCGNDVTLMSVGRRERGMQNGCATEKFRQDYSGVPVLRKLLFSRELRFELARRSKNNVILHVHGLWLMPNVYPGDAVKRGGAHLVVAPRGMLGPEALEFSKRRKQIMWQILQKRAVYAASCVHATSEKEYEEVRKFGLRQPVAIVPNGVEVAPIYSAKSPESACARTVLYLGRIHPKKGVDRLLAAWRYVEDLRSDWILRIIGPDEKGYLDRLKRQASQLELSRVIFGEALFGDVKREAYRSAELFVLPTLNENFGMTVAEALAEGTAVICTKGAPWHGLEENRCGWWVDQGIEPLAEALTQATSKEPEELIAMGKRGREWMAREFSWAAMATRMVAVYHWLSEGGAMPHFVHIE